MYYFRQTRVGEEFSLTPQQPVASKPVTGNVPVCYNDKGTTYNGSSSIVEADFRSLPPHRHLEIPGSLFIVVLKLL